jgi:hypothetical protein
MTGAGSVVESGTPRFDTPVANILKAGEDKRQAMWRAGNDSTTCCDTTIEGAARCRFKRDVLRYIARPMKYAQTTAPRFHH